MMYYLMWRILTRQHEEITLSFLPVGHTKFFPDAGFGMMKRKFRQTNVGCLADIADVVCKSATMNHYQLVGDQGGKVLVKTYDWANFFEGHVVKSALKGIKKISHFRFSSLSPGTVFVRKTCDLQNECKIKLASSDSWKPTATNLPDVIKPDGLSLTRQWYLFEKICEFCPEDVQDMVCPMLRKRLPDSSDEE